MEEFNLNFKAEEISELGNLIIDEQAGIYGFTITFKSGRIKNIFLRGNAFELRDEISEIKDIYDVIINKLES